jgi:hypothetical protein
METAFWIEQAFDRTRTPKIAPIQVVGLSALLGGNATSLNGYRRDRSTAAAAPAQTRHAGAS